MKMCFTALSVWLLFKEFGYRVLHHHNHHHHHQPNVLFSPWQFIWKTHYASRQLYVKSSLVHMNEMCLLLILYRCMKHSSQKSLSNTALRNTKPSSFLSVNESEWPETVVKSAWGISDEMNGFRSWKFSIYS